MPISTSLYNISRNNTSVLIQHFQIFIIFIIILLWLLCIYDSCVSLSKNINKENYIFLKIIFKLGFEGIKLKNYKLCLKIKIIKNSKMFNMKTYLVLTYLFAIFLKSTKLYLCGFPLKTIWWKLYCNAVEV